MRVADAYLLARMRLGTLLYRFLARREARYLLFLLVAAMIAWNVIRKLPVVGAFGGDAHIYWSIDLLSPYGETTGPADGESLPFLYPPPFVYLFGLAHALPWPVFHGLWLLLASAALIWVAREWTPVMVALPPVFNELFYGNVHLLYAAAIVLGFRWSGTWAALLLTKVTPGIGVLWFAFRREWRRLAVALTLTGAVVALSFMFTPGLWFDWTHWIVSYSGRPLSPTAYPIPFFPRLVVAAVLVAWGGHRNHRWTVPIAVTLAIPILWSAGLSVLVAMVPLVRDECERWFRGLSATYNMPKGTPGTGTAGGAELNPTSANVTTK